LRNNKIFSILLALSVIGSSAAPVFADEEVMVLPPINDQNYNVPANNNAAASNPAVLKGILTTVPVGTSFEIITNSSISTKTSHVGDMFTATLNQPISVSGDVVIPAGSEVFGQVTYSEDAGRVGRNAIMEIKFTSVKPPFGRKVPMMGKIITKDGTGVLRGGSLKSQIIKNTSAVAVTTTGGLVAGLGIGAIAGETGIGTAVGSSVGGVFGLGYIIYRKGKTVELPTGTKMIVTLEQPLTVGQ